MSDEELKELVAGLAVAQAETDRLLKQLARKAEQRQAEVERRHLETQEFLRELAEKGDRRQAEADRRHLETEELLRELAEKGDRRQAETDRLIRSMKKEIGGLANKWGSFTEGMAYPSLEKLLRKKFRMEFVAPDVTKDLGGRSIQLDVLAYANTHRNEVFVVEIKSRLRSEDVDQLLSILDSFFDFFPEHRGKNLYGILAAIRIPDDLRTYVQRQGIYTAQISDDVFKLDVPADFKPRSYSKA